MLQQGYEVWIVDSKNRRIPEYDVQVGGSVVSCHIPSESGKRFTIKWRDHNGRTGHHTSMRTFVDGNPAGRSHCSPGKPGFRWGVRTDSATVRYPFKFSVLETTDDDAALWGAASDKLGTIELRVFHIKPEPRPISFIPSVFDGVGRVHERSKKAGVHCVSLGRGVRSAKVRDHFKVSPLVPGAPPAATFVFRYRPAELLRAQGIMPAEAEAAGEVDASVSSSEAKTKGPRRSSRLGADRPSSSARRPSTALSEKKPRVKPEPTPTVACDDVIELSDDEDEAIDRKPVVKREPGRRRPYDPGDVIDLTLD